MFASILRSMMFLQEKNVAVKSEDHAAISLVSDAPQEITNTVERRVKPPFL